MKKKFNKIFTIISILIYMIPFFFVENKVSANDSYVSNEYIFGALINASQNGRSRGGSPLIGRAGGHMIGGQRGTNSRFGSGYGIKRGANSVAFNPSTVDIDVLYNDYRTFILQNNLSEDVYTLPINRTYYHVYNDLQNKNFTNGFIIEKPGANTDVNSFHLEQHDYFKIPVDYKYMFLEVKDVNAFAFDHQYWSRNSFYTTNDYNDLTPQLMRIDIQRYNTTGLRRFKVRSYRNSPSAMISVGNAYFSDYIVNPDHIEIIHNPQNMISQQDFINNYTNTFNVEYDNTTNQLIQNDNYYTYNINDFSDNSVTVDNTYITNNYTTIIESENGANVAEQLNYTSLFERVISLIKNLPQQIRDKFDDFSGGGGGSEPEPVEEGKGFWSSLFDAIASLVTSFGDFITSIPQLLLELLEGLLGLVEQVVALFIPTAEQMGELKTAFSGLTDDISLKFSPITESVQSIKTVFSSPKSIYSLTYEFEGQTINVIPIELQGQINNFKGLLNGVLVLTTFISIYKRFVGREDLIK